MLSSDYQIVKLYFLVIVVPVGCSSYWLSEPPKSVEPKHPMQPTFAFIPPYSGYIPNIQCGSPFVMVDGIRYLTLDNIPQPSK